jgi:hypothetical protein
MLLFQDLSNWRWIWHDGLKMQRPFDSPFAIPHLDLSSQSDRFDPYCYLFSLFMYAVSTGSGMGVDTSSFMVLQSTYSMGIDDAGQAPDPICSPRHY